MARIDDLVAQVGDDHLREQLNAAVTEMRKRKRFGLVYEEHVPETVLLASAVGLRPGVEVMVRPEPTNRTRYVVESIDDDEAIIVAGEERWQLPVGDLLVVKPFGEPVYPVLRSAGQTVIRGDDKPFHTVINGENFHALQLLLFAYEGKVDCVYIDPPYNTGARDWRYNNDYVDKQDAWRHSKWLSFMEKRLRLARRLLAPDSVLIATIDEHEVHHLRALLEEVFPDAAVQMVTIVVNPKGVAQSGFARVEEYALFVFLGGAAVSATPDDYMSDSSTQRNTRLWKGLLRAGTNALPKDGLNSVYPIGIDPDSRRIVGTGRTLRQRIEAGEVSADDVNGWLPDPAETVDGFPAVWPVRKGGALGVWQATRDTLADLDQQGYVRTVFKGGQWAISYVASGTRKLIDKGSVVVVGREPGNGPVILKREVDTTRAKTVWKRAEHDAGWHGSVLLTDLLGERRFDFPKSLYAVRDTLLTVIGARPDALVVDFFAGSGTTAHAVALMNAEDGGHRRALLVTNNEVQEKVAARLHAQGLFPGDSDFEQQGIFRAVTMPRVRAMLTGVTPLGAPVPGEYLDERAIAAGLDDNAAFFDLVYEDPDAIEVGERFEDVLPALWLAAGAVGDPSSLKADAHQFLMDDIPFAVLLDEDHFGDFAKNVRVRANLTHVWLVTDSDAAFSRMRNRLPDHLTIGMLFRDYLRNFRINVGSMQ